MPDYDPEIQRDKLATLTNEIQELLKLCETKEELEERNLSNKQKNQNKEAAVIDSIRQSILEKNYIFKEIAMKEQNKSDFSGKNKQGKK